MKTARSAKLPGDLWNKGFEIGARRLSCSVRLPLHNFKGLDSVETEFAQVGQHARSVERDERDIENLCLIGELFARAISVREIHELADEGFSFRNQHSVFASNER